MGGVCAVCRSQNGAGEVGRVVHQYQTERRALNHWENLFERCERIQTKFDAHSSLPVLDGQIFVYTTDRHANEDLVGRVEVQVKGRTVKRFSPSIYLRRKDLLAMQQSGGLLLLVVQFLESNVDERRAYYRMLFEPDLGEILRAASGTADEVRVPLHEAPLSSGKLHAMVELSARRAKRGVRVSDCLCAGAWFTCSPRTGRDKPRLVG